MKRINGKFFMKWGMTNINRKAYKKLIEQDKERIKKEMASSPERSHIIQVLEFSNTYYNRIKELEQALQGFLNIEYLITYPDDVKPEHIDEGVAIVNALNIAKNLLKSRS